MTPTLICYAQQIPHKTEKLTLFIVIFSAVLCKSFAAAE